jgi:hypothetical protein
MSDEELEKLRAAWAALPPGAPGPDCSPSEAIWEAVAGNRPEAEVRAMLTHALGCADCSALWRLARELSSAGQDEAAVRPPEVRALARPARTRWLVGAGTLAAAAVLALLLVPRSGPRETSPVLRGAEDAGLRADATTATIDRQHPVLRWSGAPEGSRYSVVVSTRDLTVLYRKTGIPASEAEIPVEALSAVPAGADIVWRVEAITPGGHRLASGAFLSRVP